MSDWKEHDGGPQPVAYDLSQYVQHLIDAARLEGIRLGLEAAAKEVEAVRWRWSTWDKHPRLSQWAKSLQSAYKHCELLIHNLNPDTIALDVQNISRQEKCDDLHIAREAVLDQLTSDETIASLAVNSWINGGRVVWPGANLSEADLREADLCEACLFGANLYKADLRESNLSGADLSGAFLYRADLRDADLSGADLSGAFLIGADLYGADLSGAFLTGAKFTLGNRTFTLDEETAR